MTRSVWFCLSYDCFKWDFVALKVETISIENITLSRTASWRYAPVTKCYVTCGHTIFMAWRQPLNIAITATSYDKQCYLTLSTIKSFVPDLHQRYKYYKALYLSKKKKDFRKKKKKKKKKMCGSGNTTDPDSFASTLKLFLEKSIS